MASRPYEQQVSAGGSTAAPQASGDAFGAGVGGAIVEMGDALERERVQLKAVKANEENINASLALEHANQASEQYESDDRLGKTEGWQPDGVGHTDRVLANFDQMTGHLLDDIGDHHVRQSVEARIQETRGNFIRRTENTSLALGAAGYARKSGELDAFATSSVEQSDDPADVATNVSRYTASITAMDATPEAKAAKIAQAQPMLNEAFLRGQAARHPEKVAGYIATKGYNDIGADRLLQIQQDANGEIQRKAGILHNVQALADRATREQLATITAQVEAGVQVPADQLRAASAAAERLGDTSGAFKFENISLRNQISRVTEPWTGQQYERRIGDLQALGTKRTPTQDIELDQLQKLQPIRSRMIRDDPGQWGALNGHPMPALDPSDPHSIAGRIQWQNTMSATTHVPTQFYSPNEAADLRARANGSPSERLDVINTIGNIAAVDHRVAIQTVRQVLPGDELATRLVTMDPHDRNSAARGAAARTKDRSLIDGPGTDGTAALALAKYKRDVAPALALLDPTSASAVNDLASNMYADWAYTNGVHTFNADKYGTFLHMALGGQHQADGFHGGIGYWNDQPMVLPPALTQRQFATVFTHITWGGNLASKPVFRDGSVMSPQQVRQLTPRLRPDGLYEFHGENNEVAHTANGNIFTLNFDRLAKAVLK